MEPLLPPPTVEMALMGALLESTTSAIGVRGTVQVPFPAFTTVTVTDSLPAPRSSDFNVAFSCCSAHVLEGVLLVELVGAADGVGDIEVVDVGVHPASNGTARVHARTGPSIVRKRFVMGIMLAAEPSSPVTSYSGKAHFTHRFAFVRRREPAGFVCRG